MGGASGQVQADSLLEAYTKLKDKEIQFEKAGLYLDALTIIFKDKDDKVMCLGSCGIDLAVNQLYLPKLQKTIALAYHFHS